MTEENTIVTPKLKRGLEDYISYWEKLSSRSIRLIEKSAHPLFHYTCHFYDTNGIGDFEAMLSHLYKNIGRMKIKITDRAWGTDNHTAYLRWSCHVHSPNFKKEWIFNGMSEVALSDDGKIMSHIDHWDTGKQFYLRLPLIGWLIRKTLRRMFK